MEVHIIANPASGRSTRGKVHRAMEILSGAGCHPTLEWTEGPGDGTRLARSAVA